MKQKRRRRSFQRASVRDQFETLKFKTWRVEDLAARMSELRSLRERVKRAEAGSRGAEDETLVEKHST